MSDQTHFDMLSLSVDTSSGTIISNSPSKPLAAELEKLHALAKSLTQIEHLPQGAPQGVPPPPIPLNPKRGANVTKLRDSGNAEFRKGRYAEAVKLYTVGVSMALQRPAWEPAQVVREEASALYANRAQAYMAMNRWAEGGVDAQSSVEMKKVGNAKAWWRRGKCLMEMGRLEEARDWVGKALEVEGEEEDLSKLAKEIQERLKRN